MEVGDSVKIVERTNEGVFKWDGVVVKITDAYFETTHSRDYKTHPQWGRFIRAYEKTWIKHYFYPNGGMNRVELLNI